MEKILILDYGSQYTQLIARRLRELGVFSEIHPPTLPLAAWRDPEVRGVILSGGPESGYADGAPDIPEGALALRCRHLLRHRAHRLGRWSPASTASTARPF